MCVISGWCKFEGCSELKQHLVVQLFARTVLIVTWHFASFTVSLGVVHSQHVQLCQNCDTANCPSISLFNTTAEQCLDSLGVNGSVLVSFDQLGRCQLYNDSECLGRYQIPRSVYGTWVARFTNTTCESKHYFLWARVSSE